jgi:hypothetical protein
MYPLANPNIIQTARQALSKNPVFLDAETTGLSQTDVVIEVGVVDLEGQTLYESLVKPSIPIPAEASAIHGISDAMVANAPSWKAVWEALYPVLHGRTFYRHLQQSDSTCACCSRPISATGWIGRWMTQLFLRNGTLCGILRCFQHPWWLPPAQAGSCRRSLRHSAAQQPPGR